MNPGQKEILQYRIHQGHPAFAVMNDKLLAFGGDLMVVPPDATEQTEQLIGLLLDHGKLMTFPVVFHEMEMSRCHENVQYIWDKRLHGVTARALGYALSPDGLWRMHSWGLAGNCIIETTVSRLKYFGVEFAM